MSTQNIRHTEKYLIIQTMFNDLLRTFQQSEDSKDEQIFKKSEFYSDALTMFNTSNNDISLLIFALPGLIIRQRLKDIVEIYENIQTIITSKWDSYMPNHVTDQDYLFLRLQDIHKLDKLIGVLNEFIPINIGDGIYLKSLTDALDSSIIATLEEEESTIASAANSVSAILTSVNKINMFFNRVIVSIHDEDVKNSYQEATITIKSLDMANKILNEVMNNITTRKSSINNINKEDEVSIETSSDNNKIISIIKLIKSLENKNNDHILILALKYVIRNFHINNKIMMQRMLSDKDYATMVDIILKDDESSKHNHKN